MKRRTKIWVLLILGAWGCAGTSTGNPAAGDIVVPKGAKLVMSDAPRLREPKSDDTTIKTLGNDNRAFAFDLYSELAKDNTNLFFSPYSVSVALAMTYAGAETETESEMKQVLHFSLPEPGLHDAFDATDRALKKRATEIAPAQFSDSDKNSGEGFALNIVNQAWGQKDYKFLDSYLDVLATYYGAGMFLVDFGASEPTRKLINDWVYDQTKQKIKDLLPNGSIDASTALVLTNAIYFKASWFNKFDTKMTKEGVFHAPAADRTVSMMYKDFQDALYAEGDDYQAIELPYVSKSVCMLVLLPAEGKFDAVASGLNDGFVQQILSSMKTESLVKVTMPRFSFESENTLKTPLTELGMIKAFGAADFSGIDGSGGLYIDEVYHKAFIAVDENGTEAAAATAVAMKRSASLGPKAVTLDRPFIFFIYDSPTGQILFLGHLKDPAP